MSSLRYLVEYLPTAAGSDVTVALTGVSATGAVGTLTPSTAVATTGVAGTGQVGTLTPSATVATTGVTGTGQVGTPGAALALPLTGVGATASIGSVTPSLAVPLTGIFATGAVGNVAPLGDVTVAITGVFATGQVGSVSASGGDVASVTTAGGRGARRRRAYVEIDGELFPVSDADEAAELLQKAREVAVEAAQVAVKTKPKKSKAIVPPKVTIQAPDWTDAFFQQLQAQVDAANAAIAQVYARALADEQAEDDDIQALIALGVL